MNKKILLLSALGLLTMGTIKAQTTVFSEDFEGEEITGWTLVDEDGDGDVWTLLNNSTHSRPDLAAQGVSIASFSFDNASGPLTPDNYLISPVLNLSTYAGQTIKLKWKVAAQDAAWANEKYTVYAATGNTVANFTVSPVSFTENSVPTTMTQKELDISSFAGQSVVYFAFRHYDSTDNFAIVIDDILVEATTGASTDEFFKTNFSLYPNPASDVLNIQSKNGWAIEAITIIDISGRTVKTQKGSESINVSDLASGTYMVDITTKEGKATSKFIKK